MYIRSIVLFLSVYIPVSLYPSGGKKIMREVNPFCLFCFTTKNYSNASLKQFRQIYT